MRSSVVYVFDEYGSLSVFETTQKAIGRLYEAYGDWFIVTPVQFHGEKVGSPSAQMLMNAIDEHGFFIARMDMNSSEDMVRIEKKEVL